MFITKRLAFIIYIALSTQLATQAYDAISLKQEIQSITNYIRELRQQNDSKSNAIATLFENKILDTSGTTDNDIIAMATITNNHESTINAKITALSKNINYISAYLSVLTIFGLAGFAGLLSYIRFLSNKRMSSWT